MLDANQCLLCLLVKNQGPVNTVPSVVFTGLPLALLYTSQQETPALAQGQTCLCNNIP